jgi:hypothetical protein
MSTVIDLFTRAPLAPGDARPARTAAHGLESSALPIIPRRVVAGSPVELALQRRRIGGRWCRDLLSAREGEVGALTVEGGTVIAALWLDRWRWVKIAATRLAPHPRPIGAA